MDSTALIEAVVHPDDREMLDDIRRRLRNGEDVPEIEHRIVRPDGEVRHVRERMRMIKSDDGKPIRLFGTIEDITERVRTREQLRERDALLRIAGAMAKLGAWRWDIAARRVTWSDEVAAIYDLPRLSSIDFDEATRYVAPEWREKVARMREACIRDGTPYNAEFQIITAKGRRVWVRAMGQAVRDERGSITHVEGAIQDISAAKQAEARLEELTRRLTTTLNSMSDGFITLDNDWHVTFLNRQAEQILGKPSEALLGKVIWDEFKEAVGHGVRARIPARKGRESQRPL